ncbi:hypothetical protein GCM10022415_03620 [Knoellia locipacati]|uniref:Uncharacterized protein n=1 Tax=Knoellia locipacati TaxID=882824 RepID=A0A512SWK7_9MICO|nr:hypothetical protein [Knoellia locipacati]GEQ12314.1 hypothetical protein KLO01_03610 [Knoellia locipacati]
MKVVLLSTRRLRPHMVDTAREELGLEPQDAEHMTVVSWNPPIGRLRVASHLVVGPMLSPSGRVRYARVDPVVLDEPDAGEPHDLADLTALVADADVEPLEEVTTLDVVDDIDDAETDAADPGDTDDVLADQGDGATRRTGARRVGHALKWRANRLRLTVQRHPVAQRIGGSTKVRRLRGAVTPGGLATHFALGCAQSPAVRRAVAGADLVVALDQNSHRAAWLLARRIAGPEVVVGIPAAARIVALDRDGGLS